METRSAIQQLVKWIIQGPLIDCSPDTPVYGSTLINCVCVKVCIVKKPKNFHTFFIIGP